MADDEKSKNTSGTWQEAAGDALIDAIKGDGAADAMQERFDNWANAQGNAALQRVRESIASAAAAPEESDEVIVTVVDVAEAESSDEATDESDEVVVATPVAEAEDSSSGGGSGESEEGDNEGGEGEWQTIAPEVIPVPGGQVRIYRDENGDFINAQRDEIDARDGETKIDWAVETISTEAELDARRREWVGLPAEPEEDGGPQDTDGSDQATNEEPGERDRSVPPDTELGISGAAGVPIGWSEEEGVVVPKDFDKPIDSPVFNVLREWVTEKAQPAMDERMRKIDEMTGNKPPVPDAGPSSGSSSNPPPDPMDPNQTSAINREELDVFNRFTGNGGSNGNSGGYTESGGSGTNESGAGSYLGGARADFGPTPGTSDGGADTGGAANGGGADTGDDDGGSAAGAAAGATGGTSGGSGSNEGGSATAGAGASGSTTTDDDDEPPTGTVTVDYEGVVVEDVVEDDSGGDDEAGVSTSVDPMGGNYRASTEDIERAAEWAAWQQGNKTPIDPADDGAYGESRGSTYEDRDAATELGQPAPDGEFVEQDVDPGAVATGPNPDEIMPTDDTVSDPQMGPEDDSMNPFGPPSLGGGFGSNGSSSSSEEEEEDTIGIQDTYVADVNIIEAPKDPEPAGMSAIYDPNNHQAQQAALEQEQEEDSATNKLAWMQVENSSRDLTPIGGAGELSKYLADDEEDDGLE